ncbi:hypothetical protein JOB18_008438 [Solea senegalensis]|uniref:Uncharacterized protein n=1 Tax=Solea senegalensis TaxID=28829 RepID=A0AAV6SXH3_SOLSE|nr:hypothetical protein JOB18_008438 [Solea senegalensis]
MGIPVDVSQISSKKIGDQLALKCRRGVMKCLIRTTLLHWGYCGHASAKQRFSIYDGREDSSTPLNRILLKWRQRYLT